VSAEHRLDVIYKECLQLEGIRWIEHFVDDRNAQIFWQKFFLGKKDVPWQDFYTHFWEVMDLPIPKDIGSPSQALPLLCLHEVLVTNANDTVELENWGRVTGWFGPVEIPYREGGFLDRVTDILRQRWFHGYLRTPQAEALLSTQPFGTYLFRFSNAHKGSFSLSLVSPEGKVVHYLIPYKPGVGFLWENCPYDSLQSVIAKFSLKYSLRQFAPCDKFCWLFQGNNAAIAGYLNDDTSVKASQSMDL